MTLQEKLQLLQFGAGDLPALANIAVLAAEVGKHLTDIGECNCGEPCDGNCYYADAARLHGMIDTLVDGKRSAMVGNIDDLWSQVNWAHGRHDEGEIDEDAAKAECVTAIRDYLGVSDSVMFVVGEALTKKPVEEEEDPFDADKQKHISQLIEDGAFVTMTVPVSVALRIVDAESDKDDHYKCLANLEAMLAQDLEEEFQIDSDDAFDYHEKIDQEVK